LFELFEIMDTRICKICLEEKNINDFGFHAPNKRRHICKQCQNEYTKKYRKDHPEFVLKIKERRKEYFIKYRQLNKVARNEYLKNWYKNNPDKKRSQKYRHRYNIDVDKYNELLKLQNNKCAICGSEDPQRFNLKYFMVDHDHEVNLIRGLLCHKCNQLLAMANDDVDILKSAIKYLKKLDYRLQIKDYPHFELR
jgi:hypothetical protein